MCLMRIQKIPSAFPQDNKMRSALLLWFILVVTIDSTDCFPDGFILQVQATCADADGSDDSATITVMSDLDIYVDIYCANDFRLEVPTSDYVNHIAEIPYKGNSSDECVFQKMENSATYKARVVVGYGDPGSSIHMYTDEYMITCTYDDNLSTNTSGSEIQEGVLAPEDLQYNIGETAKSVFDFQVTDVLGKPIVGSIPLGKKIKLTTTMSDPSGLASDEVSALAVGCRVVGAGKSYSILRGGCGDGVIFALDVGFHTKGKVISSPFFSAFHMFGSKLVKFECNFTICTSNCDGTSCFKETISRRKRDSNHVIRTIIIGHAETDSYKIERFREAILSGDYHTYLHKGVVRHFTDDDFMDESLVVSNTSNWTSEGRNEIGTTDGSSGETQTQKIIKDCKNLLCKAWGVSVIVVAIVVIYVTIFVLFLMKCKDQNVKDNEIQKEPIRMNSVHM